VAATDAAAVKQATPLRKTASKVVSRPMFISWLALAFMTTSSVASLRAAPSMAVFGPESLFLRPADDDPRRDGQGGVRML
jgi:glutamate:GABA antiporter